MADAQETVFRATHGVEFADTGKNGEYQKWAAFEHAPDPASPDAPPYRFATSDPKVIARLREVGEYGITEVEEAPADVGAGDSG